MLHCIINIKDEYYKTLINLLIRYISVINLKKKEKESRIVSCNVRSNDCFRSEQDFRQADKTLGWLSRRWVGIRFGLISTDANTDTNQSVWFFLNKPPNYMYTVYSI